MSYFFYKFLRVIFRHMIKANPVKKSVLQGVSISKTRIEPKPLTKPEPFKLTEAAVKKPPSPLRHVEFHARPVPKYVTEPLKPIILPKKFTAGVSPSFSKRLACKENKSEVSF